MWSEAEIRRAAEMWRAAHEALAEMTNEGDDKAAEVALADGYASALEMVLGEGS